MIDEFIEEIAEQCGEWMKELLRKMLNSDEFTDAFSAEIINARIERGDLVPRERLQIGAAVELVPAGLERDVRAVLAAVDALTAEERAALPEAVIAAIDDLHTILNPPEVVEEAPEPEAEAEPEEEPEPEDAPKVCEACGVEVDDEQALLSYTRWRKVLCKQDHADGGKSKAKTKTTTKGKS